MKEESNKKPDETPQSTSSSKDKIEKLYPDLKIVDDTNEMIGKTTLFTWIRSVRNLKKQENKRY
jgi:hypothetical protein